MDSLLASDTRVGAMEWMDGMGWDGWMILDEEWAPMRSGWMDNALARLFVMPDKELDGGRGMGGVGPVCRRPSPYRRMTSGNSIS